MDITVVIVTPQGAPIPGTVLPAEYTVRAAIYDVVNLLQLDQYGIDYSLVNETQGKNLEPDKTLIESDVHDGDRLILTSSKPVATGSGRIPSAPPPPGEKSIEVRLDVQGLSELQTKSLDLDVRAEDLVRQLAGEFRLSSGDNRTAAQAFHLSSKGEGRVLLSHETLRQARIRRHDTISMLRQAHAGCADGGLGYAQT